MNLKQARMLPRDAKAFVVYNNASLLDIQTEPDRMLATNAGEPIRVGQEYSERARADCTFTPAGATFCSPSGHCRTRGE